MASITKKKRKTGTTYYITYRIPDADGKSKQIWLPCADKKEAVYLLDDVVAAEKDGRVYVKPREYGSQPAQLSTPMLVRELIEKYINIGKEEWQPGTLQTIRGISNNYILPYIGETPVAAITPRYVQDYYNALLSKPAKQAHFSKQHPGFITPRTVREVHKILRPAFDLAVVWGELLANPTYSVKLPKQPKYTRKQWSEEEMALALSLCDDAFLKTYMSTMFSATGRSGEICGLTWDCVNISDDTIANDNSSILLNKTLSRQSKDAMRETGNRGIITVFPNPMGGKKTVMVLKGPKTDSSVRTVYMPPSAAQLILDYKEKQDIQKETYGKAYKDYNLVFAQPNGMPYDVKDVAKHFKKFVKSAGLPEVDLYSLRHSGATAKLRASGNIKAVQGDMGHSSPEMLTRVYAAIVDDDRKKNALLLEDKVYGKMREISEKASKPK